jgi:hypothetical protein
VGSPVCALYGHHAGFLPLLPQLGADCLLLAFGHVPATACFMVAFTLCMAVFTLCLADVLLVGCLECSMHTFKHVGAMLQGVLANSFVCRFASTCSGVLLQSSMIHRSTCHTHI